jgi:hypothetical protein
MGYLELRRMGQRAVISRFQTDSDPTGSQCLDIFFALVVESEGQELADDDAAPRHAILVAEKLTKYGRAPREGKIVVTNERARLCTHSRLRG